LEKIATAGNKGKRVRSDCFVSLELTENGGIDLRLESKVKTLYGKDIEQLALDVLKFFDIKNCILEIDDSGAGRPHRSRNQTFGGNR